MVAEGEVARLVVSGDWRFEGSNLGRAVVRVALGVKSSLLPCPSPRRSRLTTGSGILRPLTPQESTGR